MRGSSFCRKPSSNYKRKTLINLFCSIIRETKLDQYQYLGNCPPNPPLNSTTVNWQQVKVNVGLGEGKVGSCPDTDIDPQSLHCQNIIKVSVFGLWSLVCVLKTFHGSGKKNEDNFAFSPTQSSTCHCWLRPWSWLHWLCRT